MDENMQGGEVHGVNSPLYRRQQEERENLISWQNCSNLHEVSSFSNDLWFLN